MPESPTDLLRRVADLAMMIPAEVYGGAVVLIPPEGSPVFHLMQSAAPNAKLFWAQAGSFVQLAMQEADNSDNGWGR